MSGLSSLGGEWRVLPGYPMYHVSSDGRVFSSYVNRLLKQRLNADGYYQVTISGRGLRGVARLVLEAFDGPCPEGQQVRHLDGNSKNNVRENLKYGTPSENTYDQVRHGTHVWASKTTCPVGHPYDREVGGRRVCGKCKADAWRAKSHSGGVGNAPHGVTKYKSEGCRCGECREAWSAHLKVAREKRVAYFRAHGLPDGVPHGMSAYDAWGCRCEVCCAAQKVKRAKRTAKAKTNA